MERNNDIELFGALKVHASENGDILYFENAVLCRAETNANMDVITPEGIEEIAQTLPLKPIDIEHRATEICGTYTGGKPKDLSVLASGYIWADRFPEEANAVRSGSMFLSVEATGEIVSCTACGGKFSSSAEYCEHLQAPLAERRKNGWGRVFHGLTAKGGAITKRPAGSATQFDRQSLYLFSNLADSEDADFLRALDRVLRKYGYHILEGK